MRLTYWMTLIGFLVGLGCLQVTQRNAIVLKGYTVGERLIRVHRQEADVSWLNMQVVGLTSPTHLSQIAKELEPHAPAPEDDQQSQPNEQDADDALIRRAGHSLTPCIVPMVP